MSYGPVVVASPTANIHDGGFGLRLDRRKALGAAIGGSVALSGLARPSVAAPGVRTLVSPDQLSAAWKIPIDVISVRNQRIRSKGKPSSEQPLTNGGRQEPETSTGCAEKVVSSRT